MVKFGISTVNKYLGVYHINLLEISIRLHRLVSVMDRELDGHSVGLRKNIGGACGTIEMLDERILSSFTKW